MPNRTYQEDYQFDVYWPEKWTNLHGLQKEQNRDEFLNRSVKEREIRRIVRNFIPSTWNGINEEQRMQVCQDLETNLAALDLRLPCVVSPLTETAPSAPVTYSIQKSGRKHRLKKVVPVDYCPKRITKPVASSSKTATAGPSTAGPSTAGPSTAGPSTAGPSTAGPSTASPSTAGPSSSETATAGPSSENKRVLPKTYSINIDVNNSNSFEVLSTLVHESCHAYQSYLTEKERSLRYEPKEMGLYNFNRRVQESGLTRNDFLVMKWEMLNSTKPLTSKLLTGSTALCDMQLIETEAAVETVKFLRKHINCMGNEGDFAGFVGQKENEVKKLKELFNDPDMLSLWSVEKHKSFYDLGTVGIANRELFSNEDLEQLKIIFSSPDIKKCGLNVLKSLEHWDDKEIETVTLDQLLGQEEMNVDIDTVEVDQSFLPPPSKKPRIFPSELKKKSTTKSRIF